MKEFGRVLRLSLKNRFTVAGVFVCSLIVAVLWGANHGKTLFGDAAWLLSLTTMQLEMAVAALMPQVQRLLEIHLPHKWIQATNPGI